MSGNGLAEYINRIYPILVIVGITSAILMVIFGGYKYMTSEGDTTKITDAKDVIVSALIGLVILALVHFIVQVVGTK